MPFKFGNGIDLQNQRAQNLGSPSAGTDAANKDYVDNSLRGLRWKDAVRAATTANITLSGLQTVDGVALAANDRVLVKNQTTGSANGIYSAQSGAWVRTTDADTGAELAPGTAVTVTEGTVNGDKIFNLTSPDTIPTLGTTSLVFSQVGGGSGTTYVAGAGLTGTTTFDVGQGTGIIVTADAVAIDTSVVTRKVAANVGDGSATAIVVTHSLGTRDVDVTVRTVAAPYEEVLVDNEATDANTVTLRFGTAPASGAYRAIISG